MTVRRPLKSPTRATSCRSSVTRVDAGVAKMPRNMPGQAPKSWLNSAGWGLAILSFINLFNYLDRYLVPALFESLKRSELELSDTQLGLLMSGFLAVYTLSAPIFGALGDRNTRPRPLAFGLG